MARPGHIVVKVLYESGSETSERTRAYIHQAIKSSCRHLRDGSVVIGIYDDHDNLLGMDLTGTPSEELQDLIDDMLETYEGGPPTT